MKAITFPEANVEIAKDQPQYQTLPAYWNAEEGTIVFCFKLNQDEIDRVYATGEIYFKQLTFGHPMQPISLSALKEELI